MPTLDYIAQRAVKTWQWLKTVKLCDYWCDPCSRRTVTIVNLDSFSLNLQKLTPIRVKLRSQVQMRRCN